MSFEFFLSPGIGASLKSLLKDSDATVRHKATEVLGIVAGSVFKFQIYQSRKKGTLYIKTQVCHNL